MSYYEEGIEAYLTGIDRIHNPYFIGSEAQAQWDYGWDSALYSEMPVLV